MPEEQEKIRRAVKEWVRLNNLMSGEEWYRKFLETYIPTDHDPYEAEDILRAVKKASGL